MAGCLEQPGGVDDPAVGIELMLVGGAVADAHWSTVGIAGPSIESPLGPGVLAVECEQDREMRAVETAGVEEPREKEACLGFLARAEEGADANARVPRPREAVVPVAGTAQTSGSDVVGADGRFLTVST
jgi:hypothetical protein